MCRTDVVPSRGTWCLELRLSASAATQARGPAAVPVWGFLSQGSPTVISGDKVSWGSRQGGRCALDEAQHSKEKLQRLADVPRHGGCPARLTGDNSSANLCSGELEATRPARARQGAGSDGLEIKILLLSWSESSHLFSSWNTSLAVCFNYHTSAARL